MFSISISLQPSRVLDYKFYLDKKIFFWRVFVVPLLLFYTTVWCQQILPVNLKQLQHAYGFPSAYNQTISHFSIRNIIYISQSSIQPIRKLSNNMLRMFVFSLYKPCYVKFLYENYHVSVSLSPFTQYNSQMGVLPVFPKYLTKSKGSKIFYSVHSSTEYLIIWARFFKHFKLSPLQKKLFQKKKTEL